MIGRRTFLMSTLKIVQSCSAVLWIICVAESAFCQNILLPADKPFVHPGLLHSRADLQFIKQKVAAGEEPWKSGFEKLKINWQSLLDWKMRGPFELVVRDPQHSLHNSEMALDGNAAYQNALMWCITGDEAHAKKAVEILDAWSTMLKRMDGHDVQLARG